MSQDLQKLIDRLESVTSRLEKVGSSAPTTNGRAPAPAGSSAGSSAGESYDSLPSIAAFDDIANGTLSSFIQLSTKIGADLKTMAELVQKVFKFERSFLIEAAISTQPSQDTLNKFFQLFSQHITEVTNFREKNRKSEFFNHLSAISESIGAFGWIAVSPAPSPYVKEMSDAAQFYTNRVLKDYKEKDPNHAAWVKVWLQLLSELQAYVKQHHTTGVSWNSARKSGAFDPARVSVAGGAAATNGAAPPAPGAGGPPLPPPPPMPNFKELFADDSSSSSSKAAAPAAADALFAELNKGSDITKHLKKVDDSQKTHKNPELRAAAVVPGGVSTPSANGITAPSKAPAVAKPPVFELVDKKWKIEYQQNKRPLVVDETDLKHTVYIYQCKECTINVKGKVNSILIDSCQRVDLLFDDVLSTVEFINSKNVQMQVLGRVPTVSIDKTDGVQVYLSKKSLDTEIVSSKSSAMNILVPNENDDEYSEQPVPEQYKTVINAKSRKLVTTPTETA